MLNKKKFVVAGLLMLCILFGSAFSYASFSSSLKAKGKVDATGSFDIYFVKDSGNTLFTVGDTITATGDAEVKLKSAESADKGSKQFDTLTLDITVPADFTSGTITLYVHNAGTVTANVAASSVTSDKDNDSALTLSCSPVSIKKGETKELTLTLSKSGSSLTSGKTYTGIQLTLVYEQPDVKPVPDAVYGKH